MKHYTRNRAWSWLLVALVLASVGCNKSDQAQNRATMGRSPAVESLRPAQAAPAFTLSDLDGQMRSLESFQGKLVLLNFWATWCVPCVAEMPALERLYQLMKDQPFEIVSIATDPHEGIPDVEKFVKQKGLSFSVLLDPKMSAPEKYGITGFPETFFIDPQGKLIAVFDPEEKLNAVRLIRDRPWDSQLYTSMVKKLIQEHTDDSNPN